MHLWLIWISFNCVVLQYFSLLVAKWPLFKGCFLYITLLSFLLVETNHWAHHGLIQLMSHQCIKVHLSIFEHLVIFNLWYNWNYFCAALAPMIFPAHLSVLNIMQYPKLKFEVIFSMLLFICFNFYIKMMEWDILLGPSCYLHVLSPPCILLYVIGLTF